MFNKAMVLIFFVMHCDCTEDSVIGFAPFCPGSEKPLIMTDSFLNKNIFFVLQINYPNYTHRKRFYFGKAIDGIGNDPNVDFKNRKTMVYIHGYFDSSNGLAARVATGSYAKRGYNTINVDCLLLNSFFLPIAARANREMGNVTAIVLQGLMKYGLRPKDIEIVGLSLGSQTASFVAKHFTRLTGQKIGRITGLDPTGVCFRNQGTEHRLAPSDADFVQVMHTNNEGYGSAEAHGHVDFYFNGGEMQYFLDPYQPWCLDSCSHAFGYYYYFAAYLQNPDKFVGVKCKDVQQAREHRCFENLPHETNVVGPKADPSKPGIYYVPVRAEAPFFAPKDFLETRPNYPLLYDDAFNDVEHFVLSE